MYKYHTDGYRKNGPDLNLCNEVIDMIKKEMCKTMHIPLKDLNYFSFFR